LVDRNNTKSSFHPPQSHNFLKALLISIYFPPEIGGGSTGAWNRAMVLNKMGYMVFVLCGFPAYPSGKVTDTKYKGKFFVVEKLEPFVVFRLRLFSLEHAGYTRRLLLFLDFIFLSIIYFPKIKKIAPGIDLVYSRSPVLFSSVPGIFYSRIINKSCFIYEVPDLWPEELIVFKTRVSFFLLAFGKIIAKITYAFPDIIITISSSAADFIKTTYRPRVPVYGIPVGVEPSNFPKMSKANSRDQLVKSGIFPSDVKDKFIVLYTGIISNAQGIENLAYLAQKLIDHTDITILIFGQGPDREQLLYLTKKLSLRNLYLLPPQPRDIIPIIISGSDLCAVLLSPEQIFEIALPTKFYEYLACHKPIIGICKGELSNIINSNSIGYSNTADSLDKIASYIKDLKASSQGQMQVMEYNVDQTLKKFTLETLAKDFHTVLKNEL
jgi:glycosyltransferase involved in cell wall biosynthesis